MPQSRRELEARITAIEARLGRPVNAGEANAIELATDADVTGLEAIVAKLDLIILATGIGEQAERQREEREEAMGLKSDLQAAQARVTELETSESALKARVAELEAAAAAPASTEASGEGEGAKADAEPTPAAKPAGKSAKGAKAES